jgi:hypothetical protein
MNNMAELITVAKHWKEWSNPTCVVCVFNNEDLNQVTWEQRVIEGNPKFNASQQIPNVPYHRFGELLGLGGSSWMTRSGWRRPGMKRSGPDVRSFSRSRPIRRCRCFRRTSRLIRHESFLTCCWPGIRENRVS